MNCWARPHVNKYSVISSNNSSAAKSPSARRQSDVKIISNILNIIGIENFNMRSES